MKRKAAYRSALCMIAIFSFLATLMVLPYTSCLTSTVSIIWSKTYDKYGYGVIHSIANTNDDGYIFAGYNGTDYHAPIVRVGSTGNIVWSKSLSGAPRLSIMSIIQTNDGGFAFAAILGSSMGWSSLLVKTDSGGNTLWQDSYSGVRPSPCSVVQSDDGSIVWAGDNRLDSEGTNSVMFLIKNGISGNRVWTKTYGDPFPGNQSYSKFMIKTGDGGYALVGSSNSNSIFIKTDSNGNQLWNKTYGVFDLSEIIQTGDGGYVISGGGRFIKTDSAGTPLFTQNYSPTSFVQTNDGGYLLASGTLLTKLDSSGICEWSQEFEENIKYIIKTTDENYAIAGEKDSVFYLRKIILEFIQPDFQISLTPVTEGKADPHGYTMFSVNVDSLSGFSGEIGLSVLFSSDELSGTFDSVKLSLTAGSSTSTKIKVSVISEELATHYIYVTGQSKGKTHTASATLEVDFLSVPYYFQGDAGWCVPTSVAMVLRYYGVLVHTSDVSSALLIGNDGFGDPNIFYPGTMTVVNNVLISTYLSGIASAHPELQLSWINNFVSEDKIKELLDLNKPVIYQKVTQLPSLEHLSGGGHAVVITGYEIINGETYFYVNDPAKSIQEQRPWSELGGGLTGSWIIGVGGIPQPPIGILNAIGGGGYNYKNTWIKQFSTIWAYSISESDSLRIFQSGFPNGLSWKQTGAHTTTLGPEDRLVLDRYYSHELFGPSAGIANLIVNPTNLDRTYRFSTSLVDENGNQKWNSGLINVEDAFSCYSSVPQYEFPKMRELGITYGKYQPILSLYSSEGILIDILKLPEIQYTALSTILLHSPAYFYIQDPLGRAIGVNPATGQNVSEIPDAYYSGPNSEPQVVMIPNPINDDYLVKVIGSGTGTYSVDFALATSSGTQTKTLTGTVTPGETHQYGVDYSNDLLTVNLNTVNPTPSPTPTSSPSPTPTATPTPTSTPTPTATPTPTNQQTTTSPTTSPTQKPTTNPTANPSPTPAIPEFSTLTILLLSIAILSVTVIFRHRKSTKT